MAKYVDLEALQAYKTRQDAETAATYAAKSSIPTKVSALANDSGYQTSAQVSSSISSALAGCSKSDHTHPAATASAAGLMSAADKTKLDGIAAGANKYTYTLPTASSSTLGGVKTGSNITNSSGTISLTKANVTSALGYTPPTTNTTYSVATASANGLMSSTDKSKLDGIGSISLTEIDALFA